MQAPNQNVRRHAVLAMFALMCTANAHAEYPDRPLRYIVPQAPGSASDTSARIIAAELTRILGQQVVIDNRPGAGLTIGINLVVRAAPDGYTIGYGNIGGLAINRSMMKVPYDALKDIQPVAQTNSNGMLLAVAPQLPVKSVRELIDYARRIRGSCPMPPRATARRGTSGRTLQGHGRGQHRARAIQGGAAAMTEIMAGACT